MPSAEMIAYPKIRMEADAMLSSELKLFAQSARYTRSVKRRAKADNSSVAAVVWTVLEFQCIGPVRALVAHGTDQAGSPLPGQGEDRQDIGLVEIGVQLAIDRRAGRFDIGDIEELAIGASGKVRADRLARGRADAVTAGNVARLAAFLRPSGPRMRAIS
jgi:hypothetical protein